MNCRWIETKSVQRKSLLLALIGSFIILQSHEVKAIDPRTEGLYTKAEIADFQKDQIRIEGEFKLLESRKKDFDLQVKDAESRLRDMAAFPNKKCYDPVCRGQAPCNELDGLIEKSKGGKPVVFKENGPAEEGTCVELYTKLNEKLDLVKSMSCRARMKACIYISMKEEIRGLIKNREDLDAQLKAKKIELDNAIKVYKEAKRPGNCADCGVKEHEPKTRDYVFGALPYVAQLAMIGANLGISIEGMKGYHADYRAYLDQCAAIGQACGAPGGMGGFGAGAYGAGAFGANGMIAGMPGANFGFNAGAGYPGASLNINAGFPNGAFMGPGGALGFNANAGFPMPGFNANIGAGANPYGFSPYGGYGANPYGYAGYPGGYMGPGASAGINANLGMPSFGINASAGLPNAGFNINAGMPNPYMAMNPGAYLSAGWGTPTGFGNAGYNGQAAIYGPNPAFNAGFNAGAGMNGAYGANGRLGAGFNGSFNAGMNGPYSPYLPFNGANPALNPYGSVGVAGNAQYQAMFAASMQAQMLGTHLARQEQENAIIAQQTARQAMDQMYRAQMMQRMTLAGSVSPGAMPRLGAGTYPVF